MKKLYSAPTITRIYSMLTKDGRYYVSQWRPENAQLNLTTIPDDFHTAQNVLYGWNMGTIDNALEIARQLRESAPNDVTIWVNNILVNEEERKRDMLRQLTVAEFENCTQMTIRPMSAKTASVRQEAEKLCTDIRRKLTNAATMTPAKLKKLQSALA